MKNARRGLKRARERAGLTQEEAAERLGYSLEGYAKKERGTRKLSDEFIKSACDAFGVSADEILGELIGESEVGNLPPIDQDMLASFVAQAKDRLASLTEIEAKNLVLSLISAARKP